MPKLFDAAQGLAFLLSQLTHIEAKVFEVKYQNITYPDILPVSTEAGEYAESVTYFYMTGAALAKFVGAKSLDVPIADIGDDKIVVPVELGAIGYEYSDEELRQAVALNRDLTTMKASMARRGFEELAQRTYMLGNTDLDLPGFINNTNVTAATVVDPGSGTEWVNKTPDQILFDINDLFGDIYADSYMAEKANTLLLPVAQWSYIASTPRSANSDTTIMQYVIANSPYIATANDIKPLNELDGAGSGSTDRMIAYTKDPDKVIAHMPMPLRFTEPQRVGRGFQVPGEFKISGTEVRYPGSMRYADGI